jgi:hypothetical protein
MCKLLKLKRPTDDGAGGTVMQTTLVSAYTVRSVEAFPDVVFISYQDRGQWENVHLQLTLKEFTGLYRGWDQIVDLTDF